METEKSEMCREELDKSKENREREREKEERDPGKENASDPQGEQTEKAPRKKTELECKSARMLDLTVKTEKELREYYKELILADDRTEKQNREVADQVESLRQTSANLRKAYLKSLNMSDELKSRWKEIYRRRKRKLLPATPANAVVDLSEDESGHFARGMNLYKLLIVCFIGSFFGVLVELLWCLLRNGYLESRSGVVFGPFNLLYGFGAVMLTIALYQLRNHSKWLSFFGAMLVGSGVEYICSWGQELIMGSRSWDYSDMPFNLNGRICLLYAVFWGFLGVFWIKGMYPSLSALVLKIPNKIGKILTWTLIGFLAADVILSFFAVLRWSQRIGGAEAVTGFWAWLDRVFPNEYMEKIYANMKFGGGS